MKWKLISTFLALGTSFFATIALATTKTLSQENPRPKIIFACSSESNPPTTYAYIPGEINLKPLMAWYSEYLLPGVSAAQLCQQAAQKLQSKYDEQQKYLLASDRTDEMWKVCLVLKQGERCDSSNSVYLFSLSSNYLSPRCVMENLNPIQCPRHRGKVLSLPGGRYKPSWWFF
jgi:hypothetical protein